MFPWDFANHPPISIGLTLVLDGHSVPALAADLWLLPPIEEANAFEETANGGLARFRKMAFTLLIRELGVKTEKDFDALFI